MPIQLNITQPTNVVGTYHVAVSGTYQLMQQSVQIMMATYLDQPSFAAGKQPLITQYVDISPILATTSSTPPAGSTFGQVFIGAVEQFLIAQPNGIFFGGTQVS